MSAFPACSFHWHSFPPEVLPLISRAKEEGGPEKKGKKEIHKIFFLLLSSSSFLSLSLSLSLTHSSSSFSSSSAFTFVSIDNFFFLSPLTVAFYA
jgi:hypothetical protein